MKEKIKKSVSVIGGAGHVGLGMCLVLAHAKYKVFGIDINNDANKGIMGGKMPFIEENGQKFLNEALKHDDLFMTDDYSFIEKSDVVIFVVGTPIDQNLNPNLEPLSASLKQAGKYLKKGQLIILRSTVSPGTTGRIKEILEKATGLKVGRDIFLVFAPERVLQGKVIEEIMTLPQLIGAFDEISYKKTEAFFRTFMNNRCFYLSPIEAEIGKLMTNMARYVQFALANEYYLIADSFGANIHKVIDACTYDYPRLKLYKPGPNVGGPCLHKDGFFLIERFPFPDLISTAFKINESMPAQVFRKISLQKGIKKVCILGMAFKANVDDMRNSLSFKLKRLLENAGYKVECVDPHVAQFNDYRRAKGADCAVLMSPHNEFKDFKKILGYVGNHKCIYIDIWGFWEDMKYVSDNGIFTSAQAKRILNK